MSAVNVHEAKTHLSRLLVDVQEGREVVITKAGRPVAKLVPYAGDKPLRRPGGLAGRIWMSDDFDDDLPEDILVAFEGRD
ncbi:MAG: type II toxin-antitoxin system Phd/YefM family antitoxin [Candidatus Dormibacteria bacterium]